MTFCVKYSDRAGLLLLLLLYTVEMPCGGMVLSVKDS